MHRVEGNLKEEWLIPVSTNEGGRFSPLPIGEVFSAWAVGKLRQSIRREIRRRLPAVVTTQVHIETLLQGAQPLPTQMPLANVRRGAARGLGSFSQRLLGQRQCLHPVGRGAQLGLGGIVPSDPVGDFESGRILARQ